MRATKIAFVLGLIGLAFAGLGGCGRQETESAPSGWALISGAALGEDFTFGARVSRALFQSDSEGGALLDINLCELDCDALGLAVHPSSRAVLLNLETTAVQLVPGAIFTPADDLLAVAVRRVSMEAPLPGETAGETLVAQARAGQLIIDSIDLVPGGSIRGRFQLVLDFGDSIEGTFVAPVIELQDGQTGDCRR